MNECWIRVRKRVVGELVIEVFVLMLQAGGFKDSICDLFGSACIGANRSVRGAIKGQTALIAGGEVGVIGEDRAGVFGSAAAGECRVQFDFKMNEQGAGSFEKEFAGVFAF